MLKKDLRMDAIIDIIEDYLLLPNLAKTFPAYDDICKKTFVTQPTLKRLCTKKFGMSLYNYYLKRKMDIAADILLHDAITVKKLSKNMGYSSVHRFITIFKKFQGCTPGAFRKTIPKRFFL